MQGLRLRNLTLTDSGAVRSTKLMLRSHNLPPMVLAAVAVILFISHLAEGFGERRSAVELIMCLPLALCTYSKRSRSVIGETTR